ncbi:MAG: sterol desaturase family protein [Myxococcota bacterium]
MQRIRIWAETLVFPLVILGTMVPAAMLLAEGNAGWPEMLKGYYETIVVMSTITISFFLQLGLQRVLPYREDWTNWKSDLPVDLVHLFFSNGLASSLARAAFLPLAIWGHTVVTSSFGVVPWPTEWPWVFQLALALVIGDLGIYWLHRLAHEWMPLWRLHALHHSSEHMSLLASVRIHPLQIPLNWVTQTGPLVLLGAPPEVLALHALFTAVHGQLQHTNVGQRLGFLSYIFATVEAHRWHHSTDLEEGHTNYGNNVLIWDHLFGTFYLPGGEPEAVGIGDVSYPRNVFSHLASPWLLDRWTAPLTVVDDEAEEPVPAK